ncbi:MaoC/PaaZ C-terminal domain-containing protein [Pseudonocardia endophytica]|uniref:Acyl dehydratase n=1 Tax=Pseudonocardia endophytica TaxID=401976 RepID=A0A4R1HR47_PSEEN|nr:MaoC/PaaZ C-terminal domain-containing protein [Pseudonocardia endophytica]TCK22239.1 acyl dehydratase [Pseudonocardia endophytica]
MGTGVHTVIDTDVVGRTGEPRTRSWTATDAQLYALGVGAGLGEPASELAFTTENSDGVEQRVLPTFAVLLSQAPPPPWGDVDPSRVVHAEQAVTLHRPVPTSGTATATARVDGVYDKGSGALVVLRSEAVLADGSPLATNRSAIFVRGAGGFGGDRGPREDWALPDRAPDEVVTFATRPEQALLYRLSGDRNPLHSDPVFARRAGFDAPILHGLCTFGVAGRALLAAAGGDPDRLTAVSGRFSATVRPGQSLTTEIWRDGGGLLFRTRDGDGTVVLDRGRATLTT